MDLHTFLFFVAHHTIMKAIKQNELNNKAPGEDHIQYSHEL